MRILFLTRTADRRWLIIVVAVYIILAVISNVVTPLFEAPDEADHYRFALWLASGRPYPDLNRDVAIAGHEIWQTPLYYYSISPIVSLANGGAPDETAPLNEGYPAGYTRLVHLHTGAEDFPYKGTALAVHLARLITTLYGVGTVLVTYGLARRISPRVALTAAALVAFNPQFIFMSAVISNDVPAAFLAGLTVYWLLRSLEHEAHMRRRWFVQGFLFGFAILTKLNNAVLAAPIGIGLIIWHWPLERQWRQLFIATMLIGVASACLSGWWFFLNQVRYQDWLAWQPMLKSAEALVRSRPLSWENVLNYSAGLLKSFWLQIGYGFRGPDAFYSFFNLLLLLALVGLVMWIWRQIRQQPKAALLRASVLMMWVAASLFSLVQWMRLLTATDQGRLLFPVISGLGVLLAMGLTALTWHHISLARLMVGGLLACALLTPFIVLEPAYAHPLALPSDAVIPNTHDIRFADQISLQGFNVSSDRLDTPGDLIIDLYWEAEIKPVTTYIVRITLVDQQGRTPVIQDEMPFDGRYPTTLWQSRQRLHDQLVIPIPLQTNSRLVTVYLSVYPLGKGRDLVEGVENEEVFGRYIEIGKVKLRSHSAVFQPLYRVDIHLGNDIQLIGFDAPTSLANTNSLTFTLYWQALQPTSVDYTVFVHLIRSNGKIVAQADSQPQAGQYPTSYWDGGEQIQDIHSIPIPTDLPLGQYQLSIGLYSSSDGQRLPATRQDGSRWPNDAVSLMQYEQEKP